MTRALLCLALHVDRLWLRWARAELSSTHRDAGYIVERLATIEHKLSKLRRTR